MDSLYVLVNTLSLSSLNDQHNQGVYHISREHDFAGYETFMPPKFTCLTLVTSTYNQECLSTVQTRNNNLCEHLSADVSVSVAGVRIVL